jgi:hypothetical protein
METSMSEPLLIVPVQAVDQVNVTIEHRSDGRDHYNVVAARQINVGADGRALPQPVVQPMGDPIQVISILLGYCNLMLSQVVAAAHEQKAQEGPKLIIPGQ